MNRASARTALRLARHAGTWSQQEVCALPSGALVDSATVLVDGSGSLTVVAQICVDGVAMVWAWRRGRDTCATRAPSVSRTSRERGRL